MSISYIALCGAPEAGKSEAQRLLQEHYGFKAVDDSEILREAAKILYNLEDWHVTTQEGKATLITVGDESITVRKILGELGLYLEQKDPHHIPKQALMRVQTEFPDGKFSFGSVRRDQAKVFKSTGKGLIVEIQRAGFLPTNEFDQYDKDLVDVTITNSYDPKDKIGSTQRLLKQIQDIVEPHL